MFVCPPRPDQPLIDSKERKFAHSDRFVLPRITAPPLRKFAATVESVKAVSEVFCPVGSEIIEVNSKLQETPELINKSPHEQAWMIKVRLTHPEELKELLSAEEYEEYLQEQAE